MSDWTRKTRTAGSPIRDKRKQVPDRVKQGHKPKPKEFVLLVRENISYSYETKHKYPTKAAREQAKKDHQKAATAKQTHRFGWQNRYKIDVEFEESEE
jgi:hypothetical protein